GDNGSPLSATCGMYTGCERVIIEYSPRFDQINFADARVGSFMVAIPEPETIALFGVGLLAFAVTRRKARK
ncbi:MAG: PEP-CTERM sorting domain-containing protein, partial [Chitinophagaceae bacterium]